MVAHFYTKEDYLKVLTRGPWIVLGHYLTISKWRPNFYPSCEHTPSTLAWIRVPKLPLEMFNEKSLMRVGNAIGKTIRVDIMTKEVARGKYARICVELNLSQPLTPKVFVMGKLLSIEYEGLHRICFHCGKYGHDSHVCPLLKPAPPPEKTQTGETATDMATSQADPDSSSPYGEWILPAYEHRRQQQQKICMNQKAKLSLVNQRLNREVEEQLRGDARRATTSTGRNVESTLKLHLEYRAKQKVHAGSMDHMDVFAKQSENNKWGFTILKNLIREEEIMENIKKLKQKIRDISGPCTKGGLAHARIRHAKSMASQPSTPGNVNKNKTTTTNHAQGVQPAQTNQAVSPLCKPSPPRVPHPVQQKRMWSEPILIQSNPHLEHQTATFHWIGGDQTFNINPIWQIWR